jgi:hypothetical protein
MTELIGWKSAEYRPACKKCRIHCPKRAAPKPDAARFVLNEELNLIFVYIFMADDFELRLKGLEDRETILYQFIDKLQQDHEDSLKRFEQNELMIREIVEIQGDMLKLLDRMDQKLDDLLKSGKNGHS